MSGWLGVQVPPCEPNDFKKRPPNLCDSFGVMKKRCSRCHKMKSLEDFSRNRAKKDGRNTSCLECHRLYNREHFLRNRGYYRKKATAHKTQKRKEIRELIEKSKDVPCADCGKKYPTYVMDFDHVRGQKTFNIGEYQRGFHNTRKVQEEIGKCEVVCSNCHRERSHQRHLALVAQGRERGFPKPKAGGSIPP